MDSAPDLERRTRVAFFVPAPSSRSPHDRFLNDIFSELNHDFGGVTYSSTFPAAFHGLWLDSDTGLPDADNNILVTFDVALSESDDGFRDLLAYLAALTSRLQGALRQKLIWMVLHPVWRVTAHDLPESRP